MSAIDSYYEGEPNEVEKGQDEKGEYTLYKRSYEAPCSCHPETCCHFDEKVWRSEMYKIYKDVGTRTFRMSGMKDGEKFVKEIKAKDSESAIAYFELTYTDLIWRFITDIT